MVEFTTEAIDWLARRGFQPEFGARPLRRTIQREVDNRLSEMLLDGRLRPGQAVTVAVDGGPPGVPGHRRRAGADGGRRAARLGAGLAAGRLNA
jgi:ATP-dependent Clp protease ATP-binding subunit ClpC